MALVVKINAVDRTNHVEWSSLRWDSLLTKEVDRLEFRIKNNTSKTIPTAGQTVELIEDGVKLFGGVILEKNEIIIGGKLIAYEIRCKDYSHLLDRQVVTRSYSSPTPNVPYIKPSSIITDIISTFTSGFTVTNVQVTPFEIVSIKFNYEPVTRCFAQLCDQIGWDWYVDADKDIHFFDTTSQVAPFALSDTNGKYEWQTLNVNQNITNLKNSVFIRGGDRKKTYTASDTNDIYKGDGTRATFQLAYKYDDITVTVDGVEQSVGTDQQDEPSTVDVLYNFDGRFITFSTAPTSGQVIKIFGNAFIPIIANATDAVSIATYGRYEHAIVDKSITSVGEAYGRARVELEKYSQTVHEASFKTTEKGLMVGQRITVQSTIRSLDKTFKIVRITGRARTSGTMEYQIYLLASGQITFTDIMLDLLGRDKKNVVIADNEVLQRLVDVDETVTTSDAAPTATDTSGTYVWGGAGGNVLNWSLGTWE